MFFKMAVSARSSVVGRFAARGGPLDDSEFDGLLRDCSKQVNSKKNADAENGWMGLFEWLGEAHNPGPIGSIEYRRRRRPKRFKVEVLFARILATALVGGWGYLVLSVWQIRDPQGLLAILAGTLVYLTISYHVHPKPDMSNIGWLGGLLDHPFRFSDDMNRMLIFFAVVLLPGRFVSETFVDCFRCFRRK